MGTELCFEGLEKPVTVVRGIGAGSQGQVYEVEMGAERLALKWYFPASLKRDPQLRRRLEESIRRTAPSDSFLWPLALLRPTAATAQQLRLTEPGFGSLMALRPERYVGVHEHTGGHVSIALRTALRAGFRLADAFHHLHLRGLCYKDISLGNLFFDPADGAILICDNDNVDVDGRDLGSVLGTPGFMAPEVLLGQARPGAGSDLFSLAVLIFRLLTRHDPLLGQMEREIRCLDEPARRRLYGEDPVFIFDPADERNRPDPVEHLVALTLWPVYPLELRALFVQTFCGGLKQPNRRALTGQWKQALAACLDRRVLCGSCGQENFPAVQQEGALCWGCGTPLAKGMELRLAHGLVAAAAENELHWHHGDARQEPDIERPLARVVAHNRDPQLLGLENLSLHRWNAVLRDGRRLEISPGQRCNLAATAGLHTEAGPIEVVR